MKKALLAASFLLLGYCGFSQDAEEKDFVSAAEPISFLGLAPFELDSLSREIDRITLEMKEYPYNPDGNVRIDEDDIIVSFRINPDSLSKDSSSNQAYLDRMVQRTNKSIHILNLPYVLKDIYGERLKIYFSIMGRYKKLADEQTDAWKRAFFLTLSREYSRKEIDDLKAYNEIFDRLDCEMAK